MRSLLALAMMLCLSAPVSAQTPAASTDRSFVVFFVEWSAALDMSAASVISAAATAAKANPTEPVVVTGTADPIGSARANSLISALRAEQVANALIAAGVASTRIEQRALGGTDYQLNALESRRVIIAIGAK